MFFTFDGIDGVGKSTQIDLFRAWLGERGHAVTQCRDPGSTPLGEAVRDLAGPWVTKAGRELAGSCTLNLLTDESGRPDAICLLAKHPGS